MHQDRPRQQAEDNGAAPDPDPFVTVFTENSRRGRRTLCRLAALCAARIPAHLTEDRRAWSLRVPAACAEAAWRELDEYERVNRNFPPPRPAPAAVARDGSETAAALMTALLFAAFFLATGPADGSTRGWRVDAGAADAAKIIAGEWWRAVTALTLHADFPHLLGNAVCLFFFGRQVFLRLGWGLGWLAVLAAGGGGNLAAAWLGHPDRVSVGASTATFGALGFLCLFQALENFRAAGSWRGVWNRGWLPLVAGAGLLGFLGTGHGSDLYGHAYGFICGLILALPAAVWRRFRPPAGAVQLAVGLGSWGLLWLCWWLALRA